MAKNLRKLKDQAQKALNKGKHSKALDMYLELEQAEPGDGGWARRVADMYRRLNRNDEYLLALERAADKYGKAGFVVKAIAVCKMILQQDPSHVESQQKLAQFNAQRGITRAKSGMIKRPLAVPANANPAGAEPAAPPPVPEAPAAPAAPPPSAQLDAGAIDFDPADAGELELDTGFSGVPAAEPPPAKKVATEKALPPIDQVELPPAVDIPVEPAAAPPPVPASPPPVPASPPPVPASPPPVPAAATSIAAAASAAASPPPVPPPQKKTRTLPPGAPLDSISLSEFMPGAVPVEDGAGGEAVLQDIPLEFDLDALMAEAEMSVEDGGDAIDIGIEIDEDDGAEEAAMRLQETPFFSALGPGLLESFIDKIKLIELEAGEVLFKQGDPGNTLYVVAEGEVAVYSEGPPRIQLSRLKEGEFFGEIALVTDQPRTASIEAVEATELLAIDRDTIGDLMDDAPDLLRVLLRFLRDRLLNTLVHTNALFQSFGGAERQSLAEKFRFLEGEQGAVLIKQGSKAGGLYIVLAGQAEVLVDRDGDPATDDISRLATLGPGDLCGEMSLLANDDAVASVRLTSKAFVLKLPADVFRQVIMTHPQVLMFVGDLADERKRQLAAIHNGEAEYEIAHLDLL